jgi:bisphosphoglycerate-dependent phosphoglycerate mutase
MESLLLAALHPAYTKQKQKKHSVRKAPAVMHVYLVQHGESKSEEEDPQRRLTDKGIGEVQNIAKVLRPLKLAVDAIWHSDKARAQQTGELLAGAVWARDGLVQREGLGPKDQVAATKEALEHGGDPNATGKRLIRAAEYCDQKSAEEQTRDNHHVLHR